MNQSINQDVEQMRLWQARLELERPWTGVAEVVHQIQTSHEGGGVRESVWFCVLASLPVGRRRTASLKQKRSAWPTALIPSPDHFFPDGGTQGSGETRLPVSAATREDPVWPHPLMSLGYRIVPSVMENRDDGKSPASWHG